MRTAVAPDARPERSGRARATSSPCAPATAGCWCAPGRPRARRPGPPRRADPRRRHLRGDERRRHHGPPRRRWCASPGATGLVLLSVADLIPTGSPASGWCTGSARQKVQRPGGTVVRLRLRQRRRPHRARGAGEGRRARRRRRCSPACTAARLLADVLEAAPRATAAPAGAGVRPHSQGGQGGLVYLRRSIGPLDALALTSRTNAAQEADRRPARVRASARRSSRTWA